MREGATISKVKQSRKQRSLLGIWGSCGIVGNRSTGHVMYFIEHLKTWGREHAPIQHMSIGIKSSISRVGKLRPDILNW